MKIAVLIPVLIVLCTSCNRVDSPSISENKQDINSKHIPPLQNRMTEQEIDEKRLTLTKTDKTLRIYIDPETGEFITPEEAEVLPEKRPLPHAAYSTSQEGLEEKTSPIPGGGTMVDLRGRFQNPLTATINSSGDIKIEHKAIEPSE
jgi:hypothetical protein